MSQPTRSNSPFTGPDPAAIPAPTTGTLLAKVVAVMADLQNLYDQVAVPGVLLHEALLSSNGRSVTLTVSGIAALSSWYDAHPRSSASMGSRGEVRENGLRYGLGGLDWVVVMPGRIAGGTVEVAVKATTAEGEELPDTALVRALCPWEARLRAVQAREIAAHAGSAVAA